MKPQEIEKHHQQCEENKTLVAKNGLSGPWLTEPNRLNWKHAGLDCMIVRNQSLLFLCGYVGVPKKHPLHGAEYQNVNFDVHGGLTYSDACGGHICHTTDDPEDKTWWFGFDCGHYGDTAPGYAKIIADSFMAREGVYCTLEYVKKQTEQLAEQIAKVA